MAKLITVTECRYHRNGISGIGFYAIRFSWMDEGREDHAIATVSSEDTAKYDKKVSHNPETRVLVFGHDGGLDLNRTMRGDYFHEDLCEWLHRNPTKRTNWVK